MSLLPVEKMDTFSNLNGTVPVSPTSSGVWKIRKKSKTDDQKRGKDKNRKKRKSDKDILDISISDEHEMKNEADEFYNEEQSGYDGIAKKNKSVKRKIDLKI